MAVEDLKIYQKAIELVGKVYQLIKNNKALYNDFSLSDQIKRASISVATNISEGYCRSKKYFKNYLKIASGSANEVTTLLLIIEKVYKIDTSFLQKEYKILAKQMSSFASTF